LQKKYAAMVTDADAQLGRILAMLDQYGLANNTVVFCTSDNGGPPAPDDESGAFFQTNRGLRGYKGSLWEGGIRVPMLVRWPKRVAVGRVDATPWYFADFLPTAAQIAGAPAPKGIDGVSMVPVLSGRKMRQRPLYWEQERWEGKTRRFRENTLAQAVRWENWKAIRHQPGTPLELYDLATDPMEQKNVASANASVVERIEKYLATVRVPPRPHDNGNPEWVNRKDIPSEQ